MQNPSKVQLTTADVLGSYPDREEVQIERTIIWVMIPVGGSRQDWLEQANLLFDALWRAVPDVLNLAREISRASSPEFWHIHDLAQTSEHQLAVWGIWIYLDTQISHYHVGLNHEFAWEHPDLPEFPEDEWVMIERDRSGFLREQVNP